MAIFQRGRRWCVTVYDPARRAKRYVGTYGTHGAALEAEARAKAGHADVRERREKHSDLATPAVYFMAAPALGVVKIGYSTNPGERFIDLDGMAPTPLKLLFVIEGPPLLEREMHDRFWVQRVRGEWFAVVGELAMFIDEMSAPPDPYKEDA